MKIARRKPMLVTFLRAGERRYAVRVAVEGEPVLEMSPAPGYDPVMPHDLQHFIVERAFGIERGVYGQLAAGGTAGMGPISKAYRAVDVHGAAERSTAREASRERRKRERKSRQLSPVHQADCARSERATYICFHDWLSHSADRALRAQASKMKEGVADILAAMRPDERAFYTAKRLTEIRAQFQRLSDRWVALRIGEGMTEPW
jgi:hypothetical protein